MRRLPLHSDARPRQRPVHPPTPGPAVAQGGRRHLLPWAGTPTAAWRFLADPSAPLAQKIVFALALLYVIVPVDALPDLVPVLGWLDDLGVAAVALALLLWTIRPYRQESSSETAVGVAVIDTPGVQLR